MDELWWERLTFLKPKEQRLASERCPRHDHSMRRVFVALNEARKDLSERECGLCAQATAAPKPAEATGARFECERCAVGADCAKHDRLPDWEPTPAEATASEPAPMGEPSAETLTLFEAQRHQPWTVPYGEHKWWVVNDEGRLKHCLAHATKSIGKVAAAIERLDHSNSGWLSDAECDAVGDMAADLVSVALQIGTAVHRSVAHALVRRVKEKNGAVLDPKGGTYGRALICK